MDLERRSKIGGRIDLRLAAVLLTAAVSLPVAARPAQGDATTQLLTDITVALEQADTDAFRALGAPRLSIDSTLAFLRMAGAAPSQVVLRERQRNRAGTTTRTIVDVLISHAQTGRLTTWEITSRSGGTRADRDDLVSVSELGAVEGLRRLVLDTATAYAVHDFAFAAPDLTLRMTTGVAFVANSGSGQTAIVLHGAGELRFAPPIPAERAQLRLFSGRDVFTTRFNDAFIRVPPGAIEDAISAGSLRVGPAASDDADRAVALFADRATRTFTLNLGDLTTESWSLDPPAGSAVVEFRTAAFGWLTYTRTPGDQEDVALFDRTRRRQISIYSSAGSPEDTAPRAPGYDIQHYDVDVRIEPARAFLTARAALTIRFTEAPAGALTLRLAEPLVVSSVSSPQLGRLLPMRVVGQDQLIVSLPSAVPRDSDIRIDVAYAGRLESQPLDREAATVSTSQDDDTTAPRLPPTARFVYSTRRAWYPQAAGADYATATLRVTTPVDLQVVASGTRDERPEPAASVLTPAAAGAWRTTRFEADRPIRYLACVISKWIPVGAATASVPGAADGRVAVDTFATAPQARASADLAAEAARILTFYATAMGDAPYPTFTAASIDDDLPGGHSPAYFALIQEPRPSSSLTWRDDPVAFERVPEFVLAHEIAHQWWGQAVGYTSYHDQWLSEGLAQYFALRYITATRSPAVARAVVMRMRRSVNGLEGEGPISLGYRLGHIRGTSQVFRAILYNKSALVLDMLRRMIGDDAFTAGLRTFYATARFRGGTTAGLCAAFERASGQPLGVFFDRWIRGAALPRLAVSWHQIDARTLVVSVTQQGDAFDLPIPVAIDYADGRSESTDVRVSQPTSEYRIALSGALRRVRIDRDVTLAHW